MVQMPLEDDSYPEPAGFAVRAAVRALARRRAGGLLHHRRGGALDAARARSRPTSCCCSSASSRSSASSASSRSRPGSSASRRGEEARTLSRAIVDSLPYGAVVADREGKISYVNAQYGEFAGGIEQRRAGRRAAALCRPARSERGGLPAVARGARRPAGGRGHPPDRRARRQRRRIGASRYWYRVGVRALPAGRGRRQAAGALDGRGHHPRPRAAGQRLPRAAARHRLSRPRARRASSRPMRDGRVQYINSTLADWLGYDLAEFQSDASGARRHRARRRREPPDARPRATAKSAPRSSTSTSSAATAPSFPVRLLHRAARLADGELGETRTLVLDRRSGADSEEALRAAEVRFSRFFNDTPFAIATLDGEGRIVRTNAPFGRIFGWSGSDKSLELQPMAELLAEGEPRRASPRRIAAAHGSTSPRSSRSTRMLGARAATTPCGSTCPASEESAGLARAASTSTPST